MLINPAVRPYDDLAPYAGTQTNLYTGETFEVLPRHFDELRALAVPRITRPGRYLLLARSGDEVLDWRTMVAFYGGAWQQVRGGGDPRLRRHRPRFAGGAPLRRRAGLIRRRRKGSGRRLRRRCGARAASPPFVAPCRRTEARRVDARGVASAHGADQLRLRDRRRRPRRRRRSLTGCARSASRLAVFDEGDVAVRASRGNFGLIWVQGKGAGLPAYGALTQASARAWPRLAAALAAETGIDVALAQPGGLHLCLAADELARRVARLEAVVRNPASSATTSTCSTARPSRAALPAATLGPDVVGGTWTALDGHCNPLKLLSALHAALARAGVDYLPARR